MEEVQTILCIPTDVIIYLCKYLDDGNKIHLLTTCKRLQPLTKHLLYKKIVSLKKIIDLNYYNNFTHIRASGKMIHEMRKKGLNLPEKMDTLILNDFKGHLPTITRNASRLVHLSLKTACKITTNAGCLPKTLTHLTWESGQKLPNKIPSGLVDFRLNNYKHLIKQKLPDTIVHLTFGENCQFIIDCTFLPTNLKILTLNTDAVVFNGILPNGLVKIILGKHVSAFNSSILPPTVTDCVYWSIPPANLPPTVMNVKRIKLLS